MSEQPGHYKDFKQRIVGETLNKSKYRPAQQNEVDALFHKTAVALADVIKVITPIVKAGGAVKDEDRNKGLRPIVFQTLLQSLDGFSRDDMHTLLTCILADKIMEDVEARPYGGGTPDLLSGA